MSQDLLIALVAGAIGVVGTIVGGVTTAVVGRAAERRRLAAEDERRWLADRRRTYSEFLVLAQSMLREVDGIAVFLPYQGHEKTDAEDESLIADGLTDYFVRWDEELQPALSEVQLVAGAHVADLAERVSGALMAITPVIERRGGFVDYYPGWFRAQDLWGVLRNSMRAELGLKDGVESELPRGGGWPWLPDRPSEEEYIRRQTQIPGRPPLTEAEIARLGKPQRADSAVNPDE